MSLTEAKEMEMIHAATYIDTEKNYCITSYPVICDTSRVAYNEGQAVAIQKSIMRSLHKQGLFPAYLKEFEDFKNRGVISLVKPEEIRDWRARGKPAAFISHHPVLRPDKPTTPVRLVSKSSLPIAGKGNLSANDYWPKGANVLKPLLEIMLRFRLYQVAIHFDLSKMFHSVRSGEAEKIMRLMVWATPDKPDEITFYGPDRVMFGKRKPSRCHGRL